MALKNIRVDGKNAISGYFSASAHPAAVKTAVSVKTSAVTVQIGVSQLSVLMGYSTRL